MKNFSKKIHSSLKQVGPEHKHTYLPLEVCQIVKAQRCLKKLSDMQTSSMIKATARSAPDRETEINLLLEKAGYQDESFLQQFGISIIPKMVEFTGRVLSAPKLQYGGRNRAQALPNQGVWDMRGKQFYFGVEVSKWAILNFVNPRMIKQESINLFMSQLIKLSSDAGMSISDYPVAVDNVNPNESAESVMRYLRN